ncbi:hypothetical protein LAZ67_18001174 [Cordylochernes scorpioides]|uniref:Tc1-like transposase DDE domain-containing protein n=1 Tax=Cordylochernes scorpioides TaxID=51811 RepID=A0ABY6LKD0_9ARAC|nr:hypothetical protein LAZ67_18001174 [Cordylochernes scorpioides]
MDFFIRVGPIPVRFCLKHHDDRIRVWRHRERAHFQRVFDIVKLAITRSDDMECHWMQVSVISCSHSRHIEQSRYIHDVSRPVAVNFIRGLRNPTFQQDNARLRVAGIVRIFLHKENIQLVPRSARSPDLSPIENVWSMVAERQARYHALSMNCGIVLELNGKLYLYTPPNLCLPQCPGV